MCSPARRVRRALPIGVSRGLKERRIPVVLIDDPIEECIAILARRPLGLMGKGRVVICMVHPPDAEKIVGANYLCTQSLG